MFDEKGLIQLYIGNGKGKTTAALGLVLRASGHGAKIAVVQFMKGWDGYGELVSLPRVPNVTHVHTGRTKCIFRGDEIQEDFDEAARGLALAAEFLASGQYDLVVLDEINVAVDFGLIKAGDVIKALAEKAPRTEAVLTGRNAPDEFIKAADLVTEMKEIKHPYQNGVAARKGVEF